MSDQQRLPSAVDIPAVRVRSRKAGAAHGRWEPPLLLQGQSASFFPRRDTRASTGLAPEPPQLVAQRHKLAISNLSFS